LSGSRRLAQGAGEDNSSCWRLSSRHDASQRSPFYESEGSKNEVDERNRDSAIEFEQIVFLHNVSCLYPTYLRGEAYLASGQGKEAAGEVRKILDHIGIVWNCWTGALAHLGVARANALQAKTSQGADADAARVKALADYKDFLTLWKDADPDLPGLKEAKAEYVKLPLPQAARLYVELRIWSSFGRIRVGLRAYVIFSRAKPANRGCCHPDRAVPQSAHPKIDPPAPSQTQRLVPPTRRMFDPRHRPKN
jgi:hypothetical protein